MSKRKDIEKYLLGKNAHKHNKKQKEICKAIQILNKSIKDYLTIDPIHTSLSKISNKSLHESKQKIKKTILMENKKCIGINVIHGSSGGKATLKWMRNGPLHDFLSSKNIKANIWYEDNSATNIEFEIK